MSTIAHAAAPGDWEALIPLPLVLLPLVVPGLAPWLIMWLVALAIFSWCKWFTWRRATWDGVSWRLQSAYLCLWPGMDAAQFLLEKVPPNNSPSLREPVFALAKMGLGGVLFWGLARLVPEENILLRGWVGLVGLAFLLHFGAFHLLCCFWRRCGVNARPLMNWPGLATSITDFWGRRWNTAFRDLTHRFLFQPLSKKFGPRAAILAGFGVSGLIHDLVISIPAGGGYGLPTMYFVMQGFALLGERSAIGRTLGLGHGFVGRLFTAIVVAGPMVILFHLPFVRNVFVPFMQAAGAL
jgi:hypothetical protein